VKKLACIFHFFGKIHKIKNFFFIAAFYLSLLAMPFAAFCY